MSALLGFGYHKTAAAQPQRANGLQFNASDYGKPLPLVYGRARVPGIVIWYGDFKSKEKQQQTGKGGGGSITTYTYTFSFALAFAEGPIGGFRSWWINSAKVTDMPDAVRTGIPGQATWDHWGADALTGPALSYPNTAWAAWLNWNAGSSPSTPQVNAEIDGLLQYNAAGGVYGADPSAVIADILGNSVRGSNWPWLGDLTQYHDYCVANSLFLSPVYDTETALSDILTQLLQITNTTAVWSAGALKLLPLSDDAASANGINYVPDETIAADLTAGVDFPGPVVIDRKPDADLYNVVRVEWVNAAANYVTSVAEAKDLAHIALHGERVLETIQAHAITDPAIAAQVAQTILQNQLFIRNTFTVSDVPLTRIGLEAGDKITLTDALSGLDHEPVRIMQIDENGDLGFTLTCEEYPAGVAQGAAFALEAHAGFSPNPNAAPDTTQEPVFFRSPAGMSGVSGTPAAWIGVAGSGPNWGGANVWASFDNTSYSYIGTVHPGCRYGVLKTALAAGADPDAANSCELDLYGPGQLTGGSDGDADKGITLILIDQELIAYSATTLNGDGSYTIGGNYLRRGMYGTAIAAHAIGAPWLRVDDNFFSWTFAHDDVGETVYLKFQAFNLYDGGDEDIATLPAYSYVLGSAEEVPDTPPVPANVTVESIADGIAITWTNVNPAAVAKTQVEWSADDATWSELEETASEISTHHFTDGKTYYYRLRARSAAWKWSAYTATVSSTGKIVADGATAGATIGPGGNVNGAVDGNGRALIDFGQGTHLNKILDNIGDGIDYIRMPELGVYGVGTSRRAFIDFTSGYHLNKNLDNIADGSGFSRIEGAYVYSSTPLIDFSQTRHYNKNLDNIADGSSFSRIQGSNVYNSTPLIDFAQSRHLNKNLDNIADGSTYARIESSRVSSSRPLIDFSEGIHLNKNLDNIADGSTYMRLGANRVTAQHLQSGLSTSGATLNLDPACTDVTAWNRYSTPLMMTGVGAAPSGSTALTYTTGVSGEICSSKNIPVNLNQTYRVEMSVGLNGTVGATAYLFVAFFDASGNLISGAPVTGWGGTGSFYYFGLVNGVAPSVWTTYSFTFGPGGQGQIPSNAKFMAVGAILNANNTAGAQVFLTNVRLTQNISLDDGVTDGNTFIRLGVNRVQYAHLQNNAATTLGISVGGALTTTSAWQTVNSFTVTMRGVPVKLDFGATVAPASAPSFGDFFTWQIVEDGTTFASSNSPMVVNSYQHVPIIVNRTPSAGAHTYTIQAKTGAGPAAIISDAGLTVSELAK